MRRGPEPPPLHRVSVRAHQLAGRIVPPVAVTLPAIDRAHATMLGVREAHHRAGVPCWRPFMRTSMPFASAEPVAVEPSEPVLIEENGQIRIAA